MDLRDEFASRCAAELLASDPRRDPDDVARHAYAVADALLRARGPAKPRTVLGPLLDRPETIRWDDDRERSSFEELESSAFEEEGARGSADLYDPAWDDLNPRLADRDSARSRDISGPTGLLRPAESSPARPGLARTTPEASPPVGNPALETGLGLRRKA